MENKKGQVFAIVLVGGKGKRLRPLSTNARPKAFLSVTKDRKTMFRVTVDRIKKIIPEKNILVSANKAHLGLIKKDLKALAGRNILLEPVSRNTAPAIALAAATLVKRDKDAVMVVVPADQYIIDEKKYLDAIESGVTFARNKNCLVILGLKPTYPSTGFGYIRVQGSGVRGQGVYKVEKFTEKPDLKTAKKFIRDGRYLWNAGAFVFRASSLLSAAERSAPDIFALLKRLNKTNLNKIYKKFTDISIDYAIMEKADNIYCVKGTYGWRDIGSFEALAEVLQKESRDFLMRDEKVIKIL